MIWKGFHTSQNSFLRRDQLKNVILKAHWSFTTTEVKGGNNNYKEVKKMFKKTHKQNKENYSYKWLYNRLVQ